MPIFDQGYQHWDGRLSGHAWRWLAITRQGVRAVWKNRKIKWQVMTSFTPALILAAALILWGLLEQKSSLLGPLLFLIQALPRELREGPKAFRVEFWTMAFHYFFTIQTFFSMLLVLSVGPDLISQDLRFNAMPLYFSRPLRRVDYFLGKLGVIAAFLLSVSVAPALVAYLLGVGFSLDFSVVKDTIWLLIGAVGYGLLVVLSAGTLMLAFSSLTRNARYVGGLWVGLWIFSGVGANVLKQTVDQNWCAVVSYVDNLNRMREVMLDTETARAKFLALWETTRNAGRQVAKDAVRAASPFGRRPRPPSPDRPPPPQPPPRIADPETDRNPWTWSAGVLGGLFALSVLTLTTRVKSLDRLR